MVLAIRNFGHYWSRELVEWGARGRRAALLGRRSITAKEAHADFREQIGIYCLFSQNREVIYLGQAGRGNARLLSRLKQHTQGPMRDRWTNFSWFGFLEVQDNGELAEAQDVAAPLQGHYTDALDEVEAVLLQIIEPRLNKQGPRWRDAEEYFQFSENEPASLEGLRNEVWALWEQLEELKQE